jgi:hypothetical protein
VIGTADAGNARTDDQDIEILNLAARILLRSFHNFGHITLPFGQFLAAKCIAPDIVANFAMTARDATSQAANKLAGLAICATCL